LAETLLQFQTPVTSSDGTPYVARACGAPMAGGTWEGWLEFDAVDGTETIRSQRETTQPNRTDTEYWATGLSAVYLEGALQRAIGGPIRVPTVVVRPPVFDVPAPPLTAVPASDAAPAHGVLDPFSVYRKGEALLRRQLAALSSWHLVNIILEHELSSATVASLNATPAAALIDIIVNGVREQTLRQ
jgi:hypothetical protein